MTWRVYRWDDSGAPSLSATGSALITLLTTVLNGAGTAYGSGGSAKTAAGWTVTAISGTQSKFVNAGSGNGVLITHAAATAYANVVGIEAGNEAGPFFPTVAQQASGLFWTLSNTSDGTNRPWIIFADNKRFYLWVGYNLTTGGGLSASTTLQQMHFAGDILNYKGSDAYHFLVVGGITNASTAGTLGSGQTSISSSLVTGHYMPRSHTQSGTSIQVGKVSDYALTSTAVSGSASTWPYPDPVSGGMSLSQIRVYESNIWGPRGVMPGLWYINHSLPGNNGDTLGGIASGPLSGKSFILLDAASGGSRARFAMETTDTIGF